MKITLTKPITARQIHLCKIAAGSVLDIDDRTATYLAGRGFGDLEEVKKSKPAPVVEPKPEPVQAESQPVTEEVTESEDKPKRRRNQGA